ncbi:Mobile element protein [Methanosarcina siciliae C2J]|uniref:Mobile element protein n=1 Tax=Methanosarcina siciliae C2J TaxID=1434118 RepID=A0A0E3LDI0_9EURY|nr:Mobile element protein [Methanosarcina siciliae C2J]
MEKIKAAKKQLDEEKLKKVNITDNDARIMKHKDGSKKPSYNCQVAVDEKEQIIVAAEVVNEENDLHQMEPMTQNVKNTLGCKPTIVLADAGYFSYENLEFLQEEGIDAYIPDNFYKAEKEGKTRKFRKALFKYDEEKDCFHCPAAFEIPFTRIQKRKGEPDLRSYVCSYCSQCVLKNGLFVSSSNLAESFSVSTQCTFFLDEFSQRYHLTPIAHSIQDVIICTHTQFPCCLNNRHECIVCSCSFIGHGLKADISFPDLCSCS